MPLSFRGLERAVELRKSTALNEQRKNGRDDEQTIHAEASYLLVSSPRSSISSLSAREQQRTGRWTDEEIAFVDYLVAAFDQGALPLPHGIKLNEFLGDMLICKSSRLTKKMKNAKLSTRSFVLCSPQLKSIKNDCAVLSSLQEQFLMSVPSEATQLELRFNITKQWRTHFSNLCVQIGYPNIDGKDWFASLEEMERRASNAQDIVRKVMRRRIGLALKTDGGSSANPNVYSRGGKADSAASQLEPIMSLDNSQAANANTASANIRKLSTSEDSIDRQSNDGDEDMFAMLDSFGGNSNGPTQRQPKRQRTFSEEFLGSTGGDGGGRRPRTFSEDFDAVLNDLMEPDPTPSESKVASRQEGRPGSASPATSNHSCGPFVEAIVTYMEGKNLPFFHADVWVPSFLPRDSSGPSKAVDTEQVRLFHAGHATRGDLDDSLAYSLNEFGVYSDNFSFEPGQGLPGRVYASGKPVWDCGLTNSKLFERSRGAKVYGVRTAVGIPLDTPLVGRIVVAFYSSEAIPENISMAMDIATELVQFSPEPKWKLVIETDGKDTSQQISSNSMVTKPPSHQLQVSNPPHAISSQVVGCASPSDSRLDKEEQHIVSLMGEYMPTSNCSAGEPSSSNVNSDSLLPHFMTIRLLLLRPSTRRSAQENEMIDILKNSFRAYSKDNRRSGAELANLLAKDWVCLKSTYAGDSLGACPNPKSSPAPPPRPSAEPGRKKNLQPLMAIKLSALSSTGPINPPPSQFVSPPSSSMSSNGYMANTNGFWGSLNTQQFGTQDYRRSSIDTSPSSQQKLQNDPTQPIPIRVQPSVVMES